MNPSAAPLSPDALRDAVAADPSSPVVRARLADALARAGRAGEAEQAAREAFAAGLDGPELRLTLARVLQAQDRHEEAETAYRELVARAPGWGLAQRELAHLVWMRTGDVAAATAELDQILRARSDASEMRIHKAKLLEYAGDLPGALAVLEGAAGPPSPFVHVAAAQAAVHLDPDKAVDHARRACALMLDKTTLTVWCEALLAAGRAQEAAGVAARLVEREPEDQHALALQATAWRLLGDPRAAELYDYDRFVRVTRLDTPTGWATLDAYLADLASSLQALHGLQAHPVGQSLRGGSQTSRPLEHSDDPAVRAFFEAVDGPIRRELQALGHGGAPVTRRNLGGYRFSGIWSVRLRPEGFHVDHVHPAGWLSTACYIDLPGAVSGEGRQGWLKFGQPGTPTRPPLEAERFVKPEPGMLVLFPSYMWHGTVPFSSGERRLTIAFDLVPA